jgi:hypothetical protein
VEIVALYFLDPLEQRVEIVRDSEMTARESITASASKLEDEACGPVGIGALP